MKRKELGEEMEVMDGQRLDGQGQGDRAQPGTGRSTYREAPPHLQGCTNNRLISTTLDLRSRRDLSLLEVHEL